MRLSPSWKRTVAGLTSVALATTGLALTQVVMSPGAMAADQNGYAFNDPWALVNPGSAVTPYTAAGQPATNNATTKLPTTTGSIDVSAAFTPNAARNAGASFLTNGTTQAAYGGTAAMFLGSPTPSTLPSLGLLTNGTAGCGGALGTQAHQNFNGVCNVGSLTLNFSRPVTDMVLDISGLGGSAVRSVDADARGSFNSTVWTITDGGVTLSAPSGGATNLNAAGTTMQVAQRNTNPRCDTSGQDRPGTPTAGPRTVPAGCGSVTLRGTTTSVTFDIGSMATPFSVFPTATHQTGSGFFRNVAPWADGINGLNTALTEEAFLPGRASDVQNADLQRVSLRLPQLGQLGDRVWQDANGSGVQDPGETGAAGVTVALLDGNGDPVNDGGGNPITTTTDAQGGYLFEDLPLGDYSVRFTGLPAGFTLTQQNASGGNDTNDSDADPATGISDVVTLSSADPVNLSVDAGIAKLGSLGDRVWRDLDGDGIQDAGEPGIAGVTVVLFGANGVEVKRTTTSANGEYLFDSLPYGGYSVGFQDLPGSHAFSPVNAGDDTVDSDADPATGRTPIVTLDGATPQNLTLDAGLVPFGSIGNFVWLDEDRDGIQDSGEPGVAGAVVTLYNSSGTVATTATTGPDGAYLFDELALGDYTVGVSELPAGATLTPQGAGPDAALDSDLDPATGRSATVSLTLAAPNRLDVDAGVLVPLGSIGDRVWLDADRDGIQDTGEVGVAEVTVTLFDAGGDPVDTTTTDANGAYSFTDLPMGAYTVGFTNLPTAATLTTQGAGDDSAVDSDANPTTGRTAPITLTPAVPDHTDIDAGVLAPLGSIGDRVWRDLDGDGIQDEGEPGVPGVSVTLYDVDGTAVTTTTTDANGAYSFPDLPLGDYSVGFTTLPANTTFAPQDAGDDDTVDSDTSATGRTATITLTVDQRTITNVDAGIVQLGSIGDRVWRDLDRDGIQDEGEPGVPGVSVTLYDVDGTAVTTTTTDANGAYSFPDLPLGDYSVGFTTLPANTTFAPQDAGDDDTVDSDTSATGRTATITLTNEIPNVAELDAGIVQLGSIGDRVWRDLDRDGIQDEGEPGIPGVTVNLLDGQGKPVLDGNGNPITTSTDAQGTYLFDELPLGDYVIEFDRASLPANTQLVPQGQGGDPTADSDADPATGRTATITLTNENPNATVIDAGVQDVLGSMGDRVWLDADRDGIQDTGEVGVAGVTVTLFDAGGDPVDTTTTDANGAYSFTDLPMGAYTVGFTNLPTAATLTTQGAGDDSAVDSDANPTTGRTAPITLTPAVPDHTDIDAGVLAPLGSIGDRVWRDLDGDGIQDEGEPGVPGVSVTLYDVDGTAVTTTTTDANGAYSFPDLPLGDYSVGFTTLPANTTFAPQDAGDDDTVDSDTSATGRTATITLTVDQRTITNVDAGIVQLGSIGDRVWRDLDRDGIQDKGEPGFPGITVVLYDADGNEAGRTKTDDTGVYSFTDLAMGAYSVGFADLPTGATFSPQDAGDDDTVDSDTSATGRTTTITLTNEMPDLTTVDAGILDPLGSIGDRVWDDRNGNGQLDEGEPGVPGVTVILYDSDGNEVARTSTDVKGAYLFTGLPMGDYELAFTGIPADYRFTKGSVGNPDSDSDVDPRTGRVSVTLTPQARDLRVIDAGLLENAPGPGTPTPKPTPGPTTPKPDGGGLAYTGAYGILWLTGLGALLTAAGALMVLRRQQLKRS